MKIKKIERFKYITSITFNTMSEQIVSLRIDENIHSRMKLHDEINWSAVLRNFVVNKLDELESINFERAKRAAKLIDSLRKSTKVKGKSTTEIIREWREKRK